MQRESLAEHSHLVTQWHSARNAGLTPHDLTAGSHRRVWWVCPQGPDHEWRASPANRVRGDGCPYCAHLRPSVTNCLATVAPNLAAEWHPTRNGPLTPHDVVAGAARRVWWKCARGGDHEWFVSIDNRVRAGSGCPFCTGRRACAGQSLADQFPELAAEWHPTKNGALGPRDVTRASSRRVWWKCRGGPDHEWQGFITARTRVKVRGNGCPFCAGRRLSVTNCLATRCPKVAAEWHPTKNSPVAPDEVLMGTAKKYWWLCVSGHEWSARVSHRTGIGSGCPNCNGIHMVDSNGHLHPRYPRH
jgi:hypothetical protein